MTATADRAMVERVVKEQGLVFAARKADPTTAHIVKRTTLRDGIFVEVSADDFWANLKLRNLKVIVNGDFVRVVKARWKPVG